MEGKIILSSLQSTQWWVWGAKQPPGYSDLHAGSAAQGSRDAGDMAGRGGSFGGWLQGTEASPSFVLFPCVLSGSN